jgi:hypothetical protein
VTDRQKQDETQPSGSAKVGHVDTRSSRTEDGNSAETDKPPHQDKAAERGVAGTAGAGTETGVSGETAGALKDQVGH